MARRQVRTSPLRTGPPRTSWAARIGLIGGSILVALLLLELGARIIRGPENLLVWKNLVLEEREQIAKLNLRERFVVDPLLGFLPRPRSEGAGIHFDDEGFRVMPPRPAGSEGLAPVIATGDSFTMGDEVKDEEAWPARLQELLKRRIINAGVAAYGFDQTVLRSQMLSERMRPALIVAGFIADDLRRAEMRRTWGVEKPYFERIGNDLMLRNVPVPPSPRPAETLSFWNWALGWSVAFDSFLEMKGWRYEWRVDHKRALARGEGDKIACLLAERLAALGTKVLVVAQYDFYVWVDAEFGAEQHRQSQNLLRCAEQAGLATLDTYAAMEQAVRKDGVRSVYAAWHPNEKGQRLVARLIAAEIERRGLLK